MTLVLPATIYSWYLRRDPNSWCHSEHEFKMKLIVIMMISYTYFIMFLVHAPKHFTRFGLLKGLFNSITHRSCITDITMNKTQSSPQGHLLLRNRCCRLKLLESGQRRANVAEYGECHFILSFLCLW